jgi:hypothetical protein
MDRSESTAPPRPANAAGTTLASLAAVGSVIAASSCCLPLFPFLIAAGFAGGSTFLSAARPYLLAGSILFIGYGFYQARRARQCQRRPHWLTSALLWLSTVFVVISVVFPQVMANAVAGGLYRDSHAPSGQPVLKSLTAQNIAEIKNQFNAAKDQVRVLLLLSPT